MQVPILKQGNFLIASIQAALSDADLRQLQDDLVRRVSIYRSRGVIVDVTARQQGRALAQQVGFDGSNLTVIATAISELGRNILAYASSGVIILRSGQKAGRRYIEVVAQDEGPGIADIEIALQDGFSTSK